MISIFLLKNILGSNISIITVIKGRIGAAL